MNDKPDREFHPIEHDDEWQAQGWSTDPTPLTVDSEMGAVISIRLDAASLRLIDRAAKEAGLTWPEFVKRAAIAASKEKVDSPAASAGYRRSGSG